MIGGGGFQRGALLDQSLHMACRPQSMAWHMKWLYNINNDLKNQCIGIAPSDFQLLQLLYTVIEIAAWKEKGGQSCSTSQ